jgi:hypothetical protein
MLIVKHKLEDQRKHKSGVQTPKLTKLLFLKEIIKKSRKIKKFFSIPIPILNQSQIFDQNTNPDPKPKLKCPSRWALVSFPATSKSNFNVL